ncbi:hypothetical protein [Ramlibacter sp.]|uniref:hypothetical protein n=1 Tax=Ramlibacter sp. TaxID=1917967 RepID=UPI003D0E0DA6
MGEREKGSATIAVGGQGNVVALGNVIQIITTRGIATSLEDESERASAGSVKTAELKRLVDAMRMLLDEQ